MICSKMVKHFLLQMASLQAQPYNNFPSIVSARVGSYSAAEIVSRDGQSFDTSCAQHWRMESWKCDLDVGRCRCPWGLGFVFFGCPSGNWKDRKHMAVSSLVTQKRATVGGWSFNPHHFKDSPVSSFISSMVGWSVGVSHLQCAFCRGCHAWRVRSSNPLLAEAAPSWSMLSCGTS